MPGVAQGVDRLTERQVGAARELVEGVEVPARPLGGLQRLGQLADRLDGCLVDAVRDAVALAGTVVHAASPTMADATRAVACGANRIV